MKVNTITLRVQPATLFDALQKFGSEGLGHRLVALCLASETPGLRDGIGLALYGIQAEVAAESDQDQP